MMNSRIGLNRTANIHQRAFFIALHFVSHLQKYGKKSEYKTIWTFIFHQPIKNRGGKAVPSLL